MGDDQSHYATSYWSARSDMLYYKALDQIIRIVAADAESLIDVGTGNCGYLEWWPWIKRLCSIDIRAPYSSDNVEGIVGNIVNTEFAPQEFDVCTCMQVLEHIPKPARFARRLFEIGKIVIITVPFMWPAGKTKGHVNDPVSKEMLDQWTGRKPNHFMVISEPFAMGKSERLIAVYHPDRKYRWNVNSEKVLRDMGPIIAELGRTS